MTPDIRTWAKGDPDAIRGLRSRGGPVGVIDPGSLGAGAIYDPADHLSIRPLAYRVFDGVSGILEFGELCAEHGVGVVLVEDQFVGKVGNGAKVYKHAGWTEATVWVLNREATLVRMSASTWQNRVLPKGPRGSTKARALAFAKPHFGSSVIAPKRKDHREALADTCGMAAWYFDLVGRFR